MIFPLIVLGIASIVAGFIPFGKYVSSDGAPLATHLDIQFSIAPVALGLVGILAASWLYFRATDRPARLIGSMGGLYKTAYNKFYIDEIYLFITKKVLFNLVGRPAAWFDRNVVDGLVNLTGNSTEVVSEKIKKWQSGKVQAYAIYFLAGVVGLALLFMYVWK